MTQSTTIVRGKQTGFAKVAPSLSPFEWLGACSRWSGLTEDLGDIEWTQCQDPAESGAFVVDAELVSSGKSADGSLIMKKSVRNKIATSMKKCRWHLDIRYQLGSRRDDPFNWESIDRLCEAKFTEYSTDDESAYSDDDQGEVIITAPFKGRPPIYHLWRLSSELLTDDAITDMISALAVCNAEVCPAESAPGEGCRVVYGTAAIGGNPYFGLSTDSGKTVTWQAFDGTNGTPNWAGAITGIACLGSLIIAVSPTDGAHAYSLDGGESWTEVTLADYAAHAPFAVAIWSPNDIWICGAGGYIWKSTDSGASASTAEGGDAGDVTTQDLYRIKCYTEDVVLAVGDNNAIVFTSNSGDIWQPVPGPAAKAATLITSFCFVERMIWALVYVDGDLYWTDKGEDTAAADWVQDAQIADKNLPNLADVHCVACDRLVAVGALDGDTGVALENVHGAPGHWEDLEVPPSTGLLMQLDSCHENLFLAVGDVTYVGALGTRVRFA